MNFGPLSSEGGERRLNVLISRAKQRCEVFASLHANDIDLARASGRGVRAFKTFLQFAETGRLSLAKRTGREEDFPFEEAVRRAIESLGYEVHPQVGIAGFFVNLGIVDPAKPGRYLLGIECDGAAYHSSRSARDRDRLRQAVLEDHGWIKTQCGLVVKAVLDTTAYPTGLKVSDEELARVNIIPDKFHGEWNYCIHRQATNQQIIL